MLSGIEKKIEEKTAAEPEPKPEKDPAPVAPVSQAAPITFNLQIDAKQGVIKKTLTVEKDKAGNIIGGTVTEN